VTDRPEPYLRAEIPPAPSGGGHAISQASPSAQLAAVVQSIAEAAARADGVAPLSEEALLQVRPRAEDAPPQGADAGAAQSEHLVLMSGDGGGTDEGIVVGYAHLDLPDEQADDNDLSAELVIDPAHRRRGYGSALLSFLLKRARGQGIRVWAHGDLPAAAALARSARMSRVRALWQMRMPLSGVSLAEPAMPDGVTIRPFRPGADEAAWLAVNRRAFSHHPEQGRWTMDDLRLREAQAWFDPNGFFLAERDGRIVGFHWTKVHQPDDGTAPIGEVYVVGVDPGQQGGGLGRALTQTGLAHLRRLELAEVLLYVDEDNTAAVKLYTALGFARWSTDIMYRHP
jgi:mycothiol synthase